MSPGSASKFHGLYLNTLGIILYDLFFEAPCLAQYPRSFFLEDAEEEHPQEYSSIHSILIFLFPIKDLIHSRHAHEA